MKKEGVLFLFFITLISLFVVAIAAPSQVASSTVDGITYENSSTCSDGDSGIFSLQQGKIIARNFLGIKKVYKDTCVDTKTLREEYCNLGKARFINVLCEGGCDVASGTCNKVKKGGVEIMSLTIKDFVDGQVYKAGHIFEVVSSIDSHEEHGSFENVEEVRLSVFLKRPDQEAFSFVYSKSMQCTAQGECTAFWPLTKGSTDKINSYDLVMTVFYKTSKSGPDFTKRVSLRIEPLDTNLCKELIPRHNSPASNRANVVFVGFENYDASSLLASCSHAMDTYCFSHGYRYSSYRVYDKISKMFHFTCTDKTTSLEPSPKEVSLQELQQYDSTCKKLPIPPEDILKTMATYLVDLEGNHHGLLEVEPFKSNTEKFNFWYVDKVESVDKCTESRGSIYRVYCDEVDYLSSSCVFSNKYVVHIVDKDFISAGGNPQSLSFPLTEFKPPYAFGDSKAREFVHEFGHQFGNLRDEYGFAYRELSSSGERYPASFTPDTSMNCYAGKQQTKDECLKNAPWKDLIGNGCGKDGIVDCEENQTKNPLSVLEVGCFESCGYYDSGIFRATSSSIMKTLGDPFSFGPWNEKLLKDKLHKFIDS